MKLSSIGFAKFESSMRISEGLIIGFEFGMNGFMLIFLDDNYSGEINASATGSSITVISATF